MKRRLIQTAAGLTLCAGIALFSACGQSGPLYLPQKQAAQAPASTPARSASASTSTTATPAASTR